MYLPEFLVGAVFAITLKAILLLAIPLGIVLMVLSSISTFLIIKGIMMMREEKAKREKEAIDKFFHL